MTAPDPSSRRRVAHAHSIGGQEVSAPPLLHLVVESSQGDGDSEDAPTGGRHRGVEPPSAAVPSPETVVTTRGRPQQRHPDRTLHSPINTATRSLAASDPTPVTGIASLLRPGVGASAFHDVIDAARNTSAGAPVAQTVALQPAVKRPRHRRVLQPASLIRTTLRYKPRHTPGTASSDCPPETGLGSLRPGAPTANHQSHARNPVGSLSMPSAGDHCRA
jgi:hypothetical protein